MSIEHILGGIEGLPAPLLNLPVLVSEVLWKICFVGLSVNVTDHLADIREIIPGIRPGYAEDTGFRYETSLSRK